MFEDMPPDKRMEALFLQLIMTFETAAWQQLGKIKNPLTNKIEKNLEQARLSIDMLDMIKVKTEGNRTENETRVLETILRNLKLNYVDELEKEKKKQAEEGKEKKGEKKSGEAADVTEETKGCQSEGEKEEAKAKAKK